MKKMQWKQIWAAILTAAVLLGSVPTDGIHVLAAEKESGWEGNAVAQISNDTGQNMTSGKQKITGFEPLTKDEQKIEVKNKIALELLTARMPSALRVYLEGSSEPTIIPVTWECAGDYTGSNYYYYQFNPKWDAAQYVLSAQASEMIPYIGVFLGKDPYMKYGSLVENQEKIYTFMKKEMGFNTAAACGVVANIRSESSFNPTASCIDTNGLVSYGICQWNGPRFEALKSYCNTRGYDYTTIEAQLKYLKYELEGSEHRACSMVKNVENTAEGAYLAGYNWARYFERCASVYYESRGRLARDTYWPIYGGDVKRTKYKITYELNGGENHTDNPKYYYNTSESIALRSPTREGYTFAGWYKNSAMTQKIEVISKGSEGNIKLYAKWDVNKYTIKFAGNGADSGKLKQMNDCEYDGIYTLPKNPYQRKGYKFVGWNTKKNGKGDSYANKENVQNLSAENGAVITLYAQWSKNRYQISYQLNGGRLSEKNPTHYDVETKTITLKKPTKRGYTFEGWYKEASFKHKVTKIKKGTTGNLTLYAKWKQNKYNITYKGNGATSGNMSEVTVCKYGKKYRLMPNAFKRTGYAFVGWNTKPDGSGTFYEDEAQVKNLSDKNKKKITLYAQWKRKEYTIKYELNGGASIGNNPTKYYANTKTFHLKEPEREGYTFQGWYTEKTFKNKITKIKKGTQKNYKLYAKWKLNRYEIQFDGNGAKKGQLGRMTGCRYGKEYTLPENTYRKEGYIFIGWNTKADGSGIFYRDCAVVKNLTTENGSTVILYAQWEEDTE